jgi:hypothetical protein
MSASITGVSTVESGTIARGLQNKIVTNIVYMDPTCTNDQGYGFLWRIVDTSDGSQIALEESTTKSNTRQLFLPPRTLPEGRTYAIRFDTFNKGNPAVAASVNVILFVKASPLEPVVEGGSLGAFYTLVSIRPRSRGERRSLRTLPGVSLRLGPRFQSPTATPFNAN